MKYWMLLSLISTLSLLQSCDECKDIDCLPPPVELHFQLVDADNGEDLILNGTYQSDSIRITSQDGSLVSQPEAIDSEAGKIYFSDYEIVWNKLGSKSSYYLVLNSETKLDLSIGTLAREGTCCTFYELDCVSSSDLEIEEPGSGDIYLFKL